MCVKSQKTKYPRLQELLIVRVRDHDAGQKPENRIRTTTEIVGRKVNDRTPLAGNAHTHQPKTLRHLNRSVTDWRMMATYSYRGKDGDGYV